ncbi:hypothetical protein C8A01DRAFT_40974, partial [Parachaetomium inaequale]
MVRKEQHHASGSGSEARAGPGSTIGMTAGTTPLDGDGFPFPSAGGPFSSQDIPRENGKSRVLSPGSRSPTEDDHHDSSGSSLDVVMVRRRKMPSPPQPEDTTTASTASHNFNPPEPKTSPANGPLTPSPHPAQTPTNPPSSVTPSSTSSSPPTPSTSTPSHTPDLTHRRRGGKGKGKFTAPVFTHNFSTFDRQNPHAANSPF